MMPRSWTPLVAIAFVGALAACGDSPTAPVADTVAVRTVLLHLATSGENHTWNTDRTPGSGLPAIATGLVPIGSDAGRRVIALLDGTAIVLLSLDWPEQLDTIISPSPSSQTLASFSETGDLVAIAAYAPVPALLVYDRPNHRLDTLSLGGATPVLPPVFSPDGTRLVLFSLNDLSLLVTIVPRVGFGSIQTVPLRFSRFLNHPVFGWPRWVGTGIRLAFVRVAQNGPDTLVVGTVFPDDPDVPMEEAYRTLLVPEDSSAQELAFGDASTFALTADGTGVILGLEPVGGTSLHAVYYAGLGVPRARPVFDSAGQYPIFPLFVRE